MGKLFNTTIKKTADAIIAQLAKDIYDFLQDELKSGKQLFIALSGGSTPQCLFTILADKYKDAIPWSKLHFFWSDERCVPFKSKDSNFGTAQRLLFDSIDIPDINLHPAYTGKDPHAELNRYIDELKTYVSVESAMPCFDLMLLGMGTDGHTASIFPDRKDLFKTEDICALVNHPVTQQQRITITGKVINNSRQIIFLVTGKEKASLVNSIFKGHDSQIYPAGLVQPVHGKLKWYMDSDAAESI